jgi:hypothetical protein
VSINISFNTATYGNRSVTDTLQYHDASVQFIIFVQFFSTLKANITAGLSYNNFHTTHKLDAGSPEEASNFKPHMCPGFQSSHAASG